MKPILLYILQVIAASGLLYCYYHFVLRNKKFHQYNRFYLLMVVLVSSFIPILNIPIYFSEKTSSSSTILQTLQVFEIEGSGAAEPIVPEPSGFFNGKNILFALYFLVALLFVVRIYFSFKRIKRIIKKYRVEQFEKIKFVNTDEPGTPFSFFRWLFWNRNIELKSDKGEQIFRHELFHIRQKHSWDVIFLEIICTILWINPFFHLVKRELKAIHEFLADEFAIRESNNWQYAELLLMQALNTNNSLINPFFHNQLKRRIAMITLSRKPSYQYVRKIIVLPIAVLIVSLFAFTFKVKSRNNVGEINNAIPSHLADTTKNPNGATPEYFYDANGRQINDTVPKRDSSKWVKTGLFKGSPAPAQFKAWSDSKTFEVFLDQKRIENAALSNINRVNITLYSVGLPSKDGVNSNIYRVNLFTKQYYLVRTDSNSQNGQVKYLVVSDTTKQPQPLLVINDKPMPGLALSDLETILSPHDIESIASLKGQGAIAKYGEIGKNGAIEIKAKKLTPGKDVRIKEIIVDNNPPQNPDNKVFVKVEIEPAFRGGQKAWQDFLVKNLDPTVPVDKGAPAKTYTVILQFIVDKDGNISDLKTLTNHGFGMEEECIRIMKLSPNWEPGIQNGHIVKAYKKQPVTFVISEE